MNTSTPTLKGFAIPGAFLLTMMLVSRAHAEEYLKSYTVTGPATVRIKVDDSSVHVVTSDTNQVEFRVTSKGFSAVEIGGKLHIDSQQNGNDVELTVKLSSRIVVGFNNKRISAEVRMPKNADLQIDTSDGRVDLADVNGNIKVHTSDGAISASKLSGTIDLRSSDGSITADALTGAFKLHSGDGKISGTDLDGKCDISTGSGSIQVAGRFDSLDLKSGDGAVTARAEPGSKLTSMWSIATTDGHVEVEIPKDLQANLDASTNDGHITLGLPVSMQGDISRKSVKGTLNGGGSTLFIHSGDGSIRLNGI
jgi:Putative adhesin